MVTTAVVFGQAGEPDSKGSRMSLASQPAILTTGDASRNIVVFNDPVGAPASQSFVAGLPANASPHGVTYAGSDTALVGDFNNSRIFVVRPSDATLVSTILTASAGYNGSGTIAVPPQQNVALAIGGNSLKVIQAPFTASSAITSVALPGSVQVFQTQAIVFNSAGRAFVRHSTGISVLDAPYTSVAFTRTIDTGLFAAIAITPDGNTLIATGSNGITSFVFFLNAPFSATSPVASKSVIGGANGVKVTPDGTAAIIVSSNVHAASVLFAPFGAASTFQALPLPPGNVGFEDVDISDDGQTAILAGRSTDEPPVLIRAPFTSAGAQSSNLPVNAANPNRGGGAVRFVPPPQASAIVQVSGRVTTPSGLGLRNATVSITNSLGVRRTVTTTSFGFYNFDGVATGQTYTVTVISKRYRFASRSVAINDNFSGLDFMGLE